jgi:hypothetical protein
MPYDLVVHRAIGRSVTDTLYIAMATLQRDADFHYRGADAVAPAMAAAGSSVLVALRRTLDRLCG